MEFNPEQLEAINSNEDAILCLAAAGSGKTATLTARVARLVNDGVDPTSILALTFTNAAALEMRERYSRLAGVSTASNAMPEFRTFHSFCYNLIIHDKNIREKLGYEKVPQVCDDAEYTKIRKEVVLALGLKLTEEELKAGHSYNKEKQRQIELFNKGLKKELRSRNLITFDMMCYNVGELFVVNDETTVYYKNKYKYIACDEFQDTDPRQFKFVSSFSNNTKFFCVGDCLQSIYSFRGCTNEYIKTLAKAPNWKLVKLYRNYRSTKQICDFANKFSRYARDEYRIPMKSDREGDEVEIITGACASYDSPVDQRHLNLLIKKIQENPRETAVLCRTNKEVRAVCDYLKSANIEYNRSTKETDILSILHSTLDNEYFKEYLTTLLDGPQYADYIRLSYNNKDADLRWFLTRFNNIDKIKKQVNKVVRIRQIVTDASTSTQGKLHDIKKVLKIKESKEFDIEEGVSGRQLVEALRDIVLEQEETSVYVGTIHSVKGLEYDTVYVMGVDDKLFQLGDEEMNNLFYVAITRPMNHLTIFRR